MTVLDQPASDPHDRAVRWRQLVDLVARSGAQAGNPLVEQALHLIREDQPQVDDALRSAAYPGAAKLGRGKGYVYPHDDPAGFGVDCLPDELKGRVYYEP